MPNILRAAFRGYDKASVLKLVEELNVLLIGLEEGLISKEEALEQSEAAVSVPIKTVFSGFNKEDVDSYLSDLRERIMNWTSR
ncbi:MAG: hypothetical protein IJ071_05215 [Ruminococcus sp.]|nr:hypothetical protein [Ruminococcus sp.]